MFSSRPYTHSVKGCAKSFCTGTVFPKLSSPNDLSEAVPATPLRIHILMIESQLNQLSAFQQQLLDNKYGRKPKCQVTCEGNNQGCSQDLSV